MGGMSSRTNRRRTSHAWRSARSIRIWELGKRLMLISGVLMGWLLLVGGSVAIRSR